MAVVMGRIGEGRVSAVVRPRCGESWERLRILLTGS